MSSWWAGYHGIACCLSEAEFSGFLAAYKEKQKEKTKELEELFWAGYRWYADTYEECVEAYNRLVNKRKEILLTKLAETEMDFIKEKKR